MPLSGGTAGAHDDSMHQGNAKRDVADGVAGLGPAGELLAPGSDFELTRDGSDHIELVERTSGEIVARWTRVGVNDYTQWLHVGAVPTEILNDAMKDVANGIAGLDANARLVSDRIGVGSQRADHRSKIASANLRNSHDAEIDFDHLTITKLKTITITNGISGVLRIKHDSYTHAPGQHTYSRVYKNGVALGVLHDNSTDGVYQSYSEDLDVGAVQAGDTLELWGYIDSGLASFHKVRNFQLYYDNEPIHVVAATNSTP